MTKNNKRFYWNDCSEHCAQVLCTVVLRYFGSFFSLAVEFSDETMNDAKNVLQAISSFIRDANAYIKGQLVCDPVREDVLWER